MTSGSADQRGCFLAFFQHALIHAVFFGVRLSVLPDIMATNGRLLANADMDMTALKLADKDTLKEI